MGATRQINMNTPAEVIYFSRTITCAECGIKKTCFTKVLNAQQKKIFSSFAGNVYTYHQNEILYRIGEAIENFFILKSGSAKSFLLSKNGDYQIIGFHFPGEILGLDDLTNNLYSSSVILLEDANVCTIARNSFALLGNKIPQFQYEIISCLNKEIAHAHELLFSTNHLSAEQRIATFLLELSGRMDFIGLSKTLIRLSMSRSDIANYLGLAPETVSRLLKKFQQSGLIQVKNKDLRITDFQGMRNCANSCDKCPAQLLKNNFSAN